MIRLGISVEGATEREFVNRVLRTHLEISGIHVTAVDLRGNVCIDKIRTVLPPLLGSFDRVSTLYDFYGFKGREGRSVAALEADMASLLDAPQQRRFLPYVQQYEFEALLFAVPSQCVQWLQGTHQQHESMSQMVREAGSPEQVNDRPETSPSHRLKALFPGYDKKLHGPDVIEFAGLGEIRAQCARFHHWVSRLEQWGAAQP
ncbi:MAG: DUF4276 family protein [Paludibacterium sp.]|uniref:DUF4276 family protein n=1 Tax=Paludibacterium sp. TaxID=1917523 RepID=UPI0025F03EFD|nr:DUF4276 family protein [Paludibacterium sp.]MBV8047144.1 DUF4276 family protein [Paludibacterium sp.]MBV8645863.1 DUF4276 family protein [Paludibacterium sp.]